MKFLRIIVIVLGLTQVTYAQEHVKSFLQAQGFGKIKDGQVDPRALRAFSAYRPADRMSISLQYSRTRKSAASIRKGPVLTVSALDREVKRPFPLDVTDFYALEKAAVYNATNGIPIALLSVKVNRDPKLGKIRGADDFPKPDREFADALFRVVASDILLTPLNSVQAIAPKKLVDLAKAASIKTESSHFGTQMLLILGRGKTARFFVGSSNVQVGKSWMKLSQPARYERGHIVVQVASFEQWLSETRKRFGY